MGINLSKQTKNSRVHQSCQSSNNTEKIYHSNIKEIIEKYEYIKQTKKITDINTIIEIIQNTDWEKDELNKFEVVIPSAPPITQQTQSYIPIAEPIMIEKNIK